MSADRQYDLAMSYYLGPIVIMRSVFCVALLAGLGYVAYRATAANLHPRLAVPVAIGLPGAVVAWSLWSPASSGFRMWVVETLLVVTRLVIAFNVFFAVLKLFFVGFHVGPWLAATWPTLLTIPCAYLVYRLLHWRIAWSAGALAARGRVPA